MASSLDAGLSRKLKWVLNLESNLNAEVDDTIAKIKALGLSAKDTKDRIADYRAERAAAAEVDKVSTANLVGQVAAFGLVVAAIERGINAVERWADSIVKANDHLIQMGINTGEAGRQVGDYEKAASRFDTALDKLSVTLSGGILEKMAGLLDTMTKVADQMDRAAAAQPEGAIMGFLAAHAPLAYAAAKAAGLGGPGTTADQLDPNKISPAGYDLLGPLKTELRAPKAWKGYQSLIKQLPGVMPSVGPPTIPQDMIDSLQGQSGGAALPPELSNSYNQLASDAGIGQAASKTRRPLNAQGIANTIGAIGGGSLSSALSVLGPAGMVAGAVAGVAPNLGKSFDAIVSQFGNLPDQLTRGIDHILIALPDVITKTVPAFASGIVTELVPRLVSTLVTQFLPKLSQSITDALTPGNGHDKTPGSFAGAFFTKNGTYTYGPKGDHSGGGGSSPGNVHIHVHGGSTQEQVRSIQKVLGPYGLNLTLDPLVTGGG